MSEPTLTTRQQHRRLTVSRSSSSHLCLPYILPSSVCFPTNRTLCTCGVYLYPVKKANTICRLCVVPSFLFSGRRWVHGAHVDLQRRLEQHQHQWQCSRGFYCCCYCYDDCYYYDHCHHLLRQAVIEIDVKIQKQGICCSEKKARLLRPPRDGRCWVYF